MIILDDKDYFDSEKGVYVVYMQSPFELKTEEKIKEYENDSYDWNCYLQKAEYLSETGVYKLVYKLY